jgi:poly(3-hydroxybutyrate) depolymerase
MAETAISRRAVLAGASLLGVGGPAIAQSVRVPPPPADPEILRLADHWSFTDWTGPPVTMFSWTPANPRPDTPAIFVMHGVNRDGDRYFTEWQPVAAARGFALIAPQFDTKGFPGSRNYNLGRLKDENGVLRPRGEWAYSALDGMFSAWRTRAGVGTQRFHLFGHSAGAQFAHRALLAAPPRLLARTVSANAGFYTWPALDRAWPHGLANSPFGARALRTWLAADMTVLLGTADNDPDHFSLNREPASVAQGPHRLARGEAFFAAGRDLAAARGWRFGWKLAYAQGIGHDNARMAPFAADVLLAPAGGHV